MTKFERHIIEQEMSKDKLFQLAAAIVARYRNELAPDEIFGQLEKLRPHASRQFWSETVSWAVASGTAVNTTVTETILFPNVTIPANFMQDGRCLRLKAFGAYGTTATPTLIFSIRWGGVNGTVLAKQAANITTSGVGGGASMTAVWDLEAIIQTRSNGSAGTLMTNGVSRLFTHALLTAGTVTNYGQPAPIVSGATGGNTPVAVAADLTADTALSLTVTWGTSNAANNIQGLQYTIEALN
jgi:hypothetical protein